MDLQLLRARVCQVDLQAKFRCWLMGTDNNLDILSCYIRVCLRTSIYILCCTRDMNMGNAYREIQLPNTAQPHRK